MSQIQIDSYKMNESPVETIDLEGELLRVDLILEENDPVMINGQITGKVTDDFGFPVVGANIVLQYYSDKTVFQAVYSDENNTYLFINVPINTEFQISASDPIYIPKTLPNIITVQPFQTVNQNITLTSILGILFGILLDIHKVPVAFATLILYLNPPAPAAAILIGEVETDSNGKFIFDKVPFGSYELIAQAPLYEDVSTTFDYTNPNEPIEINLEFEQEKPATIIGTITDTTWLPIYGAIVTLKTYPEFLDVTKVFTDVLGTYIIINVVPNKAFIISAIKDQYIQSTSPPIYTTAAAIITQNLRLSDLLGSIVGVLLDTNSKPVSGSLTLYSSSGSTSIQTTTASVSGNFSFTGIPRGSYLIKASNPIYKDVSNSYSYTDANFPLSVTLRFLEENTAKIVGIITDTTSLPIYGAIVTLQTSPGLIVVTKVVSDASGNYYITGVTPDTSYVVSAIADQYVESKSSAITPLPGSTVTQNLTLSNLLGSIVGVLLDTNSKPVSGSLTLYSSSGSTSIQTTTANASGNFSFTGIYRGSYVIKASNPIYKDVSNSYSYTDANFPLSVTLQFLEVNTAKIVGEIMDSKSSPIPSATVTLKSYPELVVITTVSSDTSGNYSIIGITPNSSYMVSATANQYAESTSSTIIPSPGSTVTQNITLSDLLGSIVGNIIGNDSKPVLATLIFLYDSSGTVLIQNSITDLNGEFSFTSIPRGKYEILAQATKYQDVTTNVSYTDATAPLNVQIQFTQTKPAQIQGIVTDSKNNPISGATLNLTKQFNSTIIATITTDSNGNYSFSNIQIDIIYVIFVQANQYISTNSSAINVNYPNVYQVNFTLNDLLGSISGNVVDISSNPIVANLSLYNSVTFSSLNLNILALNPIQTTTSDSNGKFTFNNVDRGSYQVIAQNTLYKDASDSFSYTDATTTLSINIKFTQKNSVNIQGMVTNVKNQALQGATIVVSNSSNSSVIAKTSTDYNGNYIINNVSLSQSFIISVSEYLYQGQSSNVISSVNGSTLTQNFILTISSGTIAGTILDDVTSNPVQNVLVRLFSYKISTNFGTEIQDVNSDSSGNFVFLNVSVNQTGYQYYIRTFIAGYDNYDTDYITYSDNTIPFIIGNIKISPQLKAIQFYVKDNFGNFITTATITVVSSPSMQVVGIAEYISLVTVYSIGGLSAGSYIATVTAPGYSNYTSSVITLAFTDTNTAINVVLTVKGAIEGTVTDNFGAIISNNTVYLYYSSNSNIAQTTTTDNSGNYYFGNLDANNYFLGTVLSGYNDLYTGKIVVSLGTDPINYNLALIGKGSILGNVVDSSGNGISSVTVYLYYSSNSNVITSITTNSSGGYSFNSLPPNNYFLGAILSGYDSVYTGKITVNGTNISYNMTLNKSVHSPYFGKLVISTPITYNPITTNATWGQYYNGAILNFDNQFVDYLGGILGGHINVNVTVPITSGYEVKVRYLAGDRARQLKIRVIPGTAGYGDTVSTLPQTASWNVSDAQIGDAGKVMLNQGSNTLIFFNDTFSYAPALSDIYISYSPYEIVASVPNSQLFNGAYNEVLGFWSVYVTFTLSIGGPNYGYALLDYNFPVGGRYDFTFFYLSAGSNKPVSILLNGRVTTATFSQTDGSWLSDAMYGTVILYSAPGTQTIKFFNYGTDYAPALSFAYVDFVPFLKTIEPSRFQLSGGAYMQNGAVTGISSSGGSMQVTVSVDAPGNYELTFEYWQPNFATQMNIKINGVDTGTTYNLPQSADWYSPNYITVNLYLNNWRNTIEVYV